MPPKSGKGKATKMHSDSDYEESVAQHENRPRLTLKYSKSLLNKGKTVNSMSAPAGAQEMLQDPIYSRLLSPATNNEPPRKKQRVDTGSALAVAAEDKSIQDLFHDSARKLIIEEMEKQFDALDFSEASGMILNARIYGYYLFNSEDQSPKTKKTWLKEARERVEAMSIADIKAKGIGPAVKEALVEALKTECQRQAVMFAMSTKALIRMIRAQGEEGDEGEQGEQERYERNMADLSNEEDD